MDAIKRALLARFIPQRTLFGIGIGLVLLTGALEKVLASDVCTNVMAAAAICGFAGKALSLISPWLVIIGVADRERK